MTQAINAPSSATLAGFARRRRLRRAATLAAAAIASLLIWVISTPILGLDLTVGAGLNAQSQSTHAQITKTIGPVAVALVPLAAGGVAWALLALLERVATRGRLIWQIVGWAFLAVSLLGPLSMASAGALIALTAMHLVAGATLLFGMAAREGNRVS